MALSACGSDDGGGASAEGGGEPLHVGVVFSLSGPAASFGTLDRDGVELAAKVINDAGGVNGQPVKLTIVDDQSSPDKAVLAANRLITRDGVDAMIGATTGSSTLAMAPVLNRQKVPLMAPVTTVTVTNPRTDYVFRTAVSDTDAVVAGLTKIVETLGDGARIGLIHQDDASGQAGAEYFEQEAGKVGVEIVAREEVATDATDTTAQLLKIREAGADGILIQASSAVGPLTVKLARRLGMDLPIFGTPGLARATTWVVAGEAASGALIPTQIDPSNVTPQQEEFAEQFEATYPNRDPDQDPTLWDVIAYDALILLSEAVEQAGGKTDPEAIRQGLEQIQDHAGAGGDISYSATNRDGLGPEAIKWVVVEDNRLVTAPESGNE